MATPPTSIASSRAQAGVQSWRYSSSRRFPSRVVFCIQSPGGGRIAASGVRCQAVVDSRTGSPDVVNPSFSIEGNPRPVIDGLEIGGSYEREKEHKVLDPGQMIGSLFNSAKQKLLTKVMDMIFTETDNPPNRQFLGNCAPVPEIVRKTPVQVVAGAVPIDFPAGVYIRNGPNPQFGAKSMTSPLGVVDFHMFEGDGMLHATYFEEGGEISYLNRYIGTETYKLERENGRRVALPSFEGKSRAISLCYLFNSLRFGRANKVTSNTNVFKHAGKYYAVSEADLPHEFTLPDLNTVGVWDGNGTWNRPFTSHPLHDPQTKELVFMGFTPDKPYDEIGIWSADGERLVHRIDLGLERCIFCHEIAITKRYTIFFDFPLVLSKERLLSGGRIMEFQQNDAARVGILPRYGDRESIKWFPVETGFSWHKLNSFEDGDEVVVIGLRSRRSVIPSPVGIDPLDWWARGVQPMATLDADDPWIDGALSSQVHEWRFNMVTGQATERNLSGYAFSGEYPTINRSYVGIKNNYGYMNLLDLQESSRRGVALMKGFLKITFPQSAGGEIKTEMHELEPKWGASEPSFVARPNAQAEDDGWIVAYVHDEVAEISYLYIIDAQNFSGEPVAKLQLPQRVPYGFHGTYFYDQEPEHVIKLDTPVKAQNSDKE